MQSLHRAQNGTAVTCVWDRSIHFCRVSVVGHFRVPPSLAPLSSLLPARRVLRPRVRCVSCVAALSQSPLGSWYPVLARQLRGVWIGGWSRKFATPAAERARSHTHASILSSPPPPSLSPPASLSPPPPSPHHSLQTSSSAFSNSASVTTKQVSLLRNNETFTLERLLLKCPSFGIPSFSS